MIDALFENLPESEKRLAAASNAAVHHGMNSGSGYFQPAPSMGDERMEVDSIAAMLQSGYSPNDASGTHGGTSFVSILEFL